jgi:hypothetical protein
VMNPRRFIFAVIQSPRRPVPAACSRIFLKSSYRQSWR